MASVTSETGLYARILNVEDKERAHRHRELSQLAHKSRRTVSTTLWIVQPVANPTNTHACYLQRQRNEWPLDSNPLSAGSR